MEFTRRLSRLWVHHDFRKLTLVRLAGQSGDGTAQIGMASYLLFSPQSQTSAWAVAGVLALTMLPYSLIGPFVAVFLDRFSRQRISITVDLVRMVCSGVLAVLIARHLTTGASQVTLTLMLLIMLSLNRFTLAGLQAGLARTVSGNEYLDASSIMPMIGPVGLIVGGGAGGAIRLLVAPQLGVDEANALIFALAGVLFACSALICTRIDRTALGPGTEAHRATVAEVAGGLLQAVRHLASRRPAWLALSMQCVVRIGYGMLMGLVIVVYRNHLTAPGELTAALAGIGVWFLVSGVGFALSGFIAAPLGHWLGVRRCIIALLVVMGISQATLGSVPWVPTLVANGFLIGLMGQSVKVQVDTVVVAHIDDSFRGRVFTLYDMAYNVSTVLGAVIGALVLPANGVSLAVSAGLGALYLVASGGFAAASRPLGNALFDRGTRIALKEK
ncbi:hypothetical protein SAMN05443377_12320 [Propionibacterium cyclohexanicum]|uniref:Major facilitator superfamily (MFS) profile domain-containing protein n=1 Tax=Propionibacterium cyclohexanicum TaxID=64702 RepID=A0A1H9TI98_9ACTN|nr:MFS transporter [Propionibacterium cyclohexanicum]SER96589.1 hypothetical protein SAMN05443377_12320 [Propionibacterium cyclohexanicum]